MNYSLSSNGCCLSMIRHPDYAGTWEPVPKHKSNLADTFQLLMTNLIQGRIISISILIPLEYEILKNLIAFIASKDSKHIFVCVCSVHGSWTYVISFFICFLSPSDFLRFVVFKAYVCLWSPTVYDICHHLFLSPSCMWSQFVYCMCFSMAADCLRYLSVSASCPI